MTAPETLKAWQRLLWVGRVEACTLLLLVGIAVPLKYWLGIPDATRWIGPVHGVVFLVYVWCAIEAVAAALDETPFAHLPLWRLLLMGVLPFGTVLLDREVRGYVRQASGPTDIPRPVR
jgi:integral membrane protein